MDRPGTPDGEELGREARSKPRSLNWVWQAMRVLKVFGSRSEPTLED